MGNEQKIIDKIITGADTESIKIIEAANATANGVIAAAEERAAKELASYRNLAQVEAQKAAAKELSGAEMEAKKMILSAKQQCLEDAIEAAKKKLLTLEGKEYEEMILHMLEQAEKGAEIIFSQKDRELLLEAVQEKGFQVSEETRPIAGGFIVKKGEIEYNYSFESMIAVEKEEIEQIAAEILFA